MFKIVFLCHPVGGKDYEQNLKDLENIARKIVLIQNPLVIPFVPYHFDCQYLNDRNPDERQVGLSHTFEFIRRKVMDEVWVIGDKITKGMKEEIELASECGIPVRFMPNPLEKPAKELTYGEVY